MNDERFSTALPAQDDAPTPAEEAGVGAAQITEALGDLRVEEAVSPDEETTLADDLAALASQRDEYLALAQRTQADFENYRKRVAREGAAAELRGVSRLARELLPALDNLERALTVAQGEDHLVEGLRLVHRELASALTRVGIESFGERGEPFDPERHEAVAAQPADGVQAGAIAEVYQLGYRFADGAILRPARVLVAG